MFVRWQCYKPTRLNSVKELHGWGGQHWHAILVKAVRVDGKPRQQHIAYLGGITEGRIKQQKPVVFQKFWKKVFERLDTLGNRIPPEDRAKIIATIAKKIPIQTMEEIRQMEKEEQALVNHLSKYGGRKIQPKPP
jgi:hypothetical protein